jgi:hypothetical protein
MALIQVIGIDFPESFSYRCTCVMRRNLALAYPILEHEVSFDT